MENVTKSTGSLTSRVVAAGSWTLAGYGAGQLLRLGSNLIMTRLLVPEMFGLMALTQVFLYIIGLISDVGIKPSVITSKRGEEQAFLNTAWTIQIIRGLLMMSGVLLVAQFINQANDLGWFLENSAYAAEDFPLILSVMSLSLIISSGNSTNTYLANRRLFLGRLTILGLISQVSGLMIMVVWALYDRSIWALVAGALWTSFSYMILTHTSFPGEKNRFHWDKEAFWEIFHFGKWIFASSVITAFYFQGDRLFLGFFISAEMMGIYGIAYFLSSSFQGILGKINSMVFFPMFSEVARENSEKLVEYYYKIRLRTDALAIFSAGFLFASAEAIILFLYDDRYVEAGGMLEILALTLLFTAPIISSVLMYSIGNSKFPAFLKAVELLVLATAMPAFYFQMGLKGALWGLVSVHLVTAIIDIIYRGSKGMLIPKYEIRMLPAAVIGYGAGFAVKMAIINFTVI